MSNDIDLPGNSDGDLRDPALRRALDHAPDRDATPDPRTRDAIRKMAHNLAAAPAAAPASAANSASAAPWWRRLFGGGDTRARMPWNAAFATVLVAGFVTVLWHREPIPDARLDGEAKVASAPAPAPAAAPTPPAAESAPQASSPAIVAQQTPAAEAPAAPARDAAKEAPDRAAVDAVRKPAPAAARKQVEAAPAPGGESYASRASAGACPVRSAIGCGACFSAACHRRTGTSTRARTRTRTRGSASTGTRGASAGRRRVLRTRASKERKRAGRKESKTGAVHMPRHPRHPRHRWPLLPSPCPKGRRLRWPLRRPRRQHLAHRRPRTGNCRRTHPAPLRGEAVRVPTSRARCAIRPRHVPPPPRPQGRRRACRGSLRWTAGRPSTSRVQAWACTTHAATSKGWRRW
jgi:hypothetical protein